jgi:hypothetical protein|tara:strand:- start:171 stop:830 length:660 start_codon:yes stop_codon:yes gene_type:complete
MNTFLKLEEAYEMEPPKYLLSSFETIDQVIQTLVSVGYERKDDVYKEVPAPIGDLVVDSAGDGQFRVTRFGLDIKKHPEFAEAEFDSFGGCIDIHPDFRLDALAQQHDLNPKHYWLRGRFAKDGSIDRHDWRTYYRSSYWSAPNAELVDSRYWALDQINDLIFQRFGDHRGKYKELPRELDHPLAKSFLATMPKREWENFMKFSQWCNENQDKLDQAGD